MRWRCRAAVGGKTTCAALPCRLRAHRSELISSIPTLFGVPDAIELIGVDGLRARAGRIFVTTVSFGTSRACYLVWDAPAGRTAVENLTSEGQFNQFFDGARRKLVGQAYLLTGDFQEAQDLVREVLLRAWQRWDRVSTLEDPHCGGRNEHLGDRNRTQDIRGHGTGLVVASSCRGRPRARGRDRGYEGR